MKNIRLVVWLCWWIGQCLYSQPQPLHSTTHLNPWKPSPQSHPTRQRPTSSNNASVGGGILLNTSPHPAPGVTEGTHYYTGNASQTVSTMTKTNKVHNGASEDNSREHRISPSVPPPITNTEDIGHSADKSFPTIDDTAIEKGNQHGPPKNPHSDPGSHRESSLLSRPAHDHRSLDMTGEQGGHGRVLTDPNDLCAFSFCLCNSKKKNVFCKHEHTNYEKIHELTLHQHVIPPSAKTLHIAGFEKVEVKNSTFFPADLELRNIHFENIAHLELETNSLRFSAQAKENMEVVVIFTNCSIPEMPQQTFTQLTRSEDPRLDINLEMTRFLTLKFDRCNITAMRSYAFYNARLLYFHMTGTKVEIMEENSVHLDSYVEWIIEKSKLPNMIQKSICLRAQNVVVFSHNTFQGLGNRSLDILSSSQVLFEFNQVSHLRSEALLGIRPHKDARAANIVFLNNTIVKADERSLLTSKQYPMHERKIIENKFNIPCKCNTSVTFEKLLGITNTRDYTDLAILKAVIQKSLCQVHANAKTYIKVEEYKAESCTLPILAIVTGTTVAAVLLILVLVCMICTRRVQKAREEANYLGECCFSQSFSTLHSNTQLPLSMTGHPGQSSEPTSPLQPWVVAVPEVKTYRETELNVAYEHTEPIKVNLRDSFPPKPGPLLNLQCNTQMRSSCPFN